MFLLFGAFIAGMLTVLAPCVLPLLPIIIGGSVSGNLKDKKRPLIIAGALAVSLIVFTLLLKVTTILINLPPQTITYISGGLLAIIGVVMLLPSMYARLIARLGIEQKAQETLNSGYKNKGSISGPIIIGAALGPVFSSCSPVYAYILATVLPAHFGQAMAYVIAYVIGLCALLLAIGYYGQQFVRKLKFASNPKGWFQRTIAVLFIVVGVLIFTGYNQKFQTYVSAHTPFNIDSLSTHFLPTTKHKVTNSGLFNVKSYPAPELTGLQWINSPPQTLAQLKGKVVLVDFWTYSCINCLRNTPNLVRWYNTYKDNGFVVIGVSAPEFAFEKIPANVEKAVKNLHITYPVGLDNNYATWNAFNNQSWPAGYLIDAKGNVRRVDLGEGQYTQTEQAIRALLTEKGANLSSKPATKDNDTVPITAGQTPETYFGSARASDFVGSPDLGSAATQTYSATAARDLPISGWTLGGKWEVDDDQIIARGNSVLRFNVSAKNVYLVGGSDTPATIGVKLNGQPISPAGAAGSDVQNSTITINGSRLYTVVNFSQFTSGSVVELGVPDGVPLNTFTFGS
jgi:cytochrome c biogenesis protein CcdA/thiol-disulfide isomerase/thioredoxin